MTPNRIFTGWILLALLPAFLAYMTVYETDAPTRRFRRPAFASMKVNKTINRKGGKSGEGWGVYGGDKGNSHYSGLSQVDTGNVGRLRVAWVYHTGDAGPSSQIEVNPIIIGRTLYGVSPKLKLFALDAATGDCKWVFDPEVNMRKNGWGGLSVNVCRGVAYYTGPGGPRIFYTAGSRLYCIDANSGLPLISFGKQGSIDLHEGLGDGVKDRYVTSTTPGIIYKNLIIMGTRVAEDAGAAPGHIRAYDVHTGKIKWLFHTIPYPGEAGYNSWEDKESYKHAGGVNAWAGFSLDEGRGIVYAPLGSATYDFYGGKRKGNDLYANCVIALDAATGKRLWHFQTVHHDVWDRDPPSAPVLVDVQKNGRKVAGVVQLTKGGFLFLLDRATGKPLYPVIETPVPWKSGLDGEMLSRTQPVPTFFKPFARQAFGERDLNRLVPDSSYRDILRRYEGYRKEGIYTPPSRQGSLVFPGLLGGGEWGGPGYDPQTGILYINANETANIITMEEVKDVGLTASQTNVEAGKTLYRSNCMGCHGPNREGGGNYPSLVGVGRKYDETAFLRLITSGRRMMPAFKQLSTGERAALASFILDLKALQQQPYLNNARPTDYYLKMPYSATGYNRFMTGEGYPANSPPWGTLSAVDLNSGKELWRDTLGDYQEFKEKGIHTGAENYGGPVVTAGGLLFIAATRDAKFRAYNKRTGSLLWETDLPAAGLATPAVYAIDGRQYIVIACGGGGKAKVKTSDAYVAFALP